MKRVYVDMDGVLADYDKRFLARRHANPNNDFPQMEYGFFTKLEEMEGAKTGINLLAKHFDVWIATRPSLKNPLCYVEKRVWVEEPHGS